MPAPPCPCWRPPWSPTLKCSVGVGTISRNMQAKLYFLIGWLAASAAFAQGTFTYTFSGDDSAMNVWATFQATSNAVATSYLTTGNVSGAYLLQGGTPMVYIQPQVPR